MKKLSIEEKAKRYDIAIELVNSKWHYKNQPCIIDVSEIFPELKENDDEKMWKLIKKYLHYNISDLALETDHITREHLESWLETQSKQKSTDNIKPKFKTGDWIIDKQGFIHQIKNVLENVTNDTFGYDIVGGGYFNDNADVRLWTIKDAKDGDILASKDGQSILIFKNLDTTTSFSSHYNIQHKGELGWSTNSFIPATKEQCNLLFQSMKEAGYEWNIDKKIPIKVTAISKTQTSQYCYILNYNTGEAFKHHITEDEVNLTTEELLKKYGFKETECHIMYSSNNLELKLLED